jgi:hypothetical protein
MKFLRDLCETAVFQRKAWKLSWAASLAMAVYLRKKLFTVQLQIYKFTISHSI